MMDLVDRYLAVRRAVNFQLQKTERRLRSFARYAAERGDSHVRSTTAIDWAGTGRSAHERHGRLHDVAIFARHLRAEDHQHEVPPTDVYHSKHHKRLPYIFSDDDIRRLVKAAGQLGPSGNSQGDTYRTLLALLAVSGLRISEALALQVRDVTPNGLQIRNTKFRKSRMVPLHPSSIAALTSYRVRWRAIASAEDPFFVSPRGTALASGTVHRACRALLSGLGLGKDVRLHDLRHTFAVRALEDCPQGRFAINQHMLALSTYLGHATIANTYWYLHATPSLMVDIADACETMMEGGER